MIAVGVDTHKQRHTAVVLDRLGQLLGELSIEARLAGYRELDAWVHCLVRDGQQVVFGIEGAGSWGAGLCEYLQGAGRSVLEVERPRRRERRTGKSDRIDALSAAKRVLSEEGTSTPCQQGIRRALAALLIAQRSAVAERTRLLNQLQSLHATAPVALRERIGEAAASSCNDASRRCALAQAHQQTSARCSPLCATWRHARTRSPSTRAAMSAN